MFALHAFQPQMRAEVAADVVEEEPAIDLVHLARQTDGDLALEAELLALFDCQAAKLLARLGQDDFGARAKADIAHRLRGSALAIGAGRVAEAAQAIETYYEKAGLGERTTGAPLEALASAVAEARATIAKLTD